jgi:energy-coupling factor transport system substrate-specific component
MVAVVASLAALTALGRDAFVALPDVKPITAMTLVTGYALGPLPGFTVGALGMLASNILLGEGPYTPWQMVAWGGVGLLGALIGRLTGRRLGRLPLAVACAVAALGAKEVMNGYVWTLGGVYTPSALLARVGEGLPFDLTDAISSLLFGLAFAPELARLLGRVRARMHVRWEVPGGLPVPLVLIAVTLGGLSLAIHANSQARAADAPGTAVARALSYLEGARNADGGFPGSPGERSSELYSAWAALALAAGGRDPALAASGRHSVIESLAAEASTLEGPGDMERTMLALHAGGAPVERLGNLNLEARLLAARRPDGSVGDQVNLTAFAILALSAAGRPAGDAAVRGAAQWLARQQNSDGGFSYAARSAGAPSDVDDSGAVLQALVAAGTAPQAGVVQHAVSYMRGTEGPDGGFPQQPGGESDAQSTAWAIQGLIAAGIDVEGVRRRAGEASPLAYLERLQAANGSIRYSRASEQTPVWVTAEALPALAGRALPIAPPAGATGGSAGGAGAGSHAVVGDAARGTGSSARRGIGNAAGPGSQTVTAWMPVVVGSFTRTLSAFAHEALGRVGVVVVVPPPTR